MRISDWSSDVCSSDLKEINEKANNPVISVVRFAGEPTARLYRTTSFSGIVLQDAGLKRPDNQGPDPADAGNIMMKISPELINEADADVIFISTWQDAEGKSAEAAKPFLESPLWRSEEHTSELQSLMRISY